MDGCVKKYKKNNSHFTIVLDMCRLGSNESFSQDIPSNVSLVFSTQVNRAAFEFSNTSLFCDAFLSSLNHTPKTYLYNSHWCNLHNVLNNIRNSHDIFLKSTKQKMEVHGNFSDEIMIPSIEVDIGTPYNYEQPVTAIFSQNIDTRTYQECYSLLKNLLYSWYGKEINLRKHLIVLKNNDSYKKGIRIKVILPPKNIFLRPHTSMNYIISNCYSLFYTMHFSWEKCIKVNKIRRIAKLLNIEDIEISESEYLLIWKNKDKKAKILFSTSCNNKTDVEISCLSKEGFCLPINYMMPDICDIFDCLYDI